MATEETKIVLTGSFKNKQATIDAIKQVDKGIKSVGVQAQNTQKPVNSLTASLKKLAKIVGLSILVKKFIDLGRASLTAAGQMQQYNVAFTTMLGSVEKAKSLMEDAIEFAAKTPFQLDGVLDATKQLLAYNTAQEDVIPTLRNLGDIAAGTGADIRLIAKAWGDVKTKGKLAGQETLQFANAGVPIIKELANTFNLTTKEVVDLQAKGQISFAMVNKAIQGMTAEGGKFFNLMDAQSKTFLGTVSNMEDGFFQVKVALGNALLPVAQDVVNKLIVWFDSLQKSIEENSESITKFAKSIKTSLSLGISLVVKFGKGIAFLVSQPLIKWLGLATAGVYALRTAFLLLAKNPIIFFITSIITVVGWLIDKFDNFSSDVQIALLEATKPFKQFEADVATVVEAILNKLSFLSKAPGFGWVDDARDKFSKLKDSTIKDIEEINAKIEELQKKPFKAGENQEGQEEKAKQKDNKEVEKAKERSDAIVEISEDRAKRLEEIEQEKNDALLQSELDFIEGTTTLKELEAEQDATRREEELALLQEHFVAKLENQALDDEQRLALKTEFETKKAEIDKKYKVSEGTFQKAFNVASAKVQKQADGMRVKAGNDLYTNLTSSIDAFAAHNKQAARAQQLIAAGETIVATYLGATKAFAIGGGYPFGIPPMLATIAQGLGNLATIKSQSFAVGASEIPQDMTAQIHQGEMIIPKTFAQSIRGGDLTLGGSGGDVGSQQASTGNTININFEGATFIGDVNDEMLVDIGTRMGELINEDLLTPLPTGAS